jgi:hypothetical protein
MVTEEERRHENEENANFFVMIETVMSGNSEDSARKNAITLFVARNGT